MEATARPRSTLWLRLAGLAATLAAILLITLIAPFERTLGSGLRLIYFHGAWVWAGIITFGLAALTGLVGMALRKGIWPSWSLALGRTGMFFWLTYLPLSLVVMQLYWGGLFLDEPRWRIPFAFGIVGVLLQAGLFLLGSPLLACAGNFAFGTALIISLRRAENILHPDSPIFTSDSILIRVFFILLLALSLLFSAQLALWLKKRPD